MALFNYASRELTLKIVYYGPGLSGKTTNLQHLHMSMPQEKAGKLISLSTETDRTLFFDFLSLSAGGLKDFAVKFQLYTVPGQVRYNSTRKLVLKGADAVVFVADSQAQMREYNIESFRNMRENLRANNIDPDDIPIVLQYNKRDLEGILSPEELDRDLNAAGYPTVRSEAISGKGVAETFQLISKGLLDQIRMKYKIDIQPAAARTGQQAQPVAAHPSPSQPVSERTEPALEPATSASHADSEETPAAGEQTAALEHRAKDEAPPPFEMQRPFETQAPIEMQTPFESQSGYEMQTPFETQGVEGFGYLDEVSGDINRALSEVSAQMTNSNETVVSALTTVSESMKTLISELKALKRRQNEIAKALEAREEKREI